MLECNRLRIDVGDGSTVLDYRIEDGSVQSRSLRLRDGKSPVVERDWHWLTPQQLSSLVKGNKVARSLAESPDGHFQGSSRLHG